MPISPFLLPPLPLHNTACPWGSYGNLEYQAVASLSRLDGMMDAASKADQFWFTWLMKESQCSNLIEGTVTTFDEIFGENAGVVIPISGTLANSEVHKARTA